MKPVHLSTLGLILILVACGPAAPAITPAVTDETGVGAVTAAVATVLPEPIGTSLPFFTPPPVPTSTPIPPLPSGLSPTELKYRILDQYPDFFFCDPDYYPVPHDDELSLAKQRFPQIQSDAELFNAILAHNHLSGLTTFTDDQKLTIYRDYKKLNAVIFQKSGNAYQFNIQIGPEGQGFAIIGTIDGAGTIAEQQRNTAVTTCPICLAKGTLIDTPRGPVAVEEMRVGMPVWTAAPNADRVVGVVLKVVRVFVPPDHRVVHLRLDDGRELFASPGHPMVDGRTLSDLVLGDLLDGSHITHIEQTSYSGAATYDILPSGPSGFYWANGILVGSTLAIENRFNQRAPNTARSGPARFARTPIYVLPLFGVFLAVVAASLAWLGSPPTLALLAETAEMSSPLAGGLALAVLAATLLAEEAYFRVFLARKLAALGNWDWIGHGLPYAIHLSRRSRCANSSFPFLLRFC